MAEKSTTEVEDVQIDRNRDDQTTLDEAIAQAEANAQTDAENIEESGAHNVEADVKTSDAQEELKPEGDVTPTEDVTGDDTDAQKPEKVLEGGRKTAKKNVAAEVKAQPEGTEDGTTDPLEQGRKTAEKNHKAEVAAAKEANAKRR